MLHKLKVNKKEGILEQKQSCSRANLCEKAFFRVVKRIYGVIRDCLVKVCA